MASKLSLHASRVALTPARSLTSHLRRRYHTRYHGRYRFPLTLFFLDIGLLCVIFALTVFIGIWLVRSSYFGQSGFDISLIAPNMRAGDIVPVRLDVRVVDGRRHEDVRIAWNLPPWIEVIRSEPSLSKNEEIYVGALAPSQTLSSYLLVRVKAQAGTQVPFTVTVHQFDSIGLHRNVVGSVARTVEASAITLEPLLDTARVTPNASVPFVLRNTSDAAADAVSIRLTHQEGFSDVHFDPRETSLVLGSLDPHEERMIFVDLGKPDTTSTGRLVLEVEDGGYIVTRTDMQLEMKSGVPLTLAAESSDPREGSAVVRYAGAPVGTTELAVIHPLMTSEKGGLFNLYALSKSEGTVTIPLRQDRAPKSLEWSVIPLFGTTEGGRVIGERAVGLVNQSFPVSSMVRYTTLAGDQIGVGPVPPRVGEKTTYWIVWTIGPGSFSAHQVALAAQLAPHVQATGAFSTSLPSAFSTDGQNVNWSVPDLTLAEGQTVTVAFEVSLSPVSGMAGKPATLLVGGVATAQDAQTGARLTTRLREQTTDGSQDPQLQDKGIVE